MVTEKFVRNHLPWASATFLKSILSDGLTEKEFLMVLKTYLDAKNMSWKKAVTIVLHRDAVKNKARSTKPSSPWFNPDSKNLPLAECRKIKPGTFIRVRWYDSDDSVWLVTEKMHRENKFLSALDQNYERRGINYDQITAIVTTLGWPT